MLTLSLAQQNCHPDRSEVEGPAVFPAGAHTLSLAHVISGRLRAGLIALRQDKTGTSRLPKCWRRAFHHRSRSEASTKSM